MSTALARTAPQFTLPGVDGSDHSLDDYRDASVLVLVQSCNHCPYVQAWEGRLIDVARDYADRGVRVVAISSNDVASHPEDSFEEMKKRAKEKGFNFPYLRDETQETARAYTAERTPHVHVFDAERKLRYTGKIDDNMEHPERVKTRFLQNAVESLLAGGAPAESQTFAIGCTIKWRTP